MSPAPRKTVGEWLDEAAAFFEKSGVPEARANAELIVAAVLKTGRNEAKLQACRPLNGEQGRRLRRYVQERGKRRPLAYVLGHQNFMGLDLAVAPAVLVPRPETEELVVEARRRLRSSGSSDAGILDIGTGSGCVAIALARSFPSAAVRATDISPAALALARRNARAHGLSRRIRFVREDIFEPSPRATRRADLIVSNPPYVPSAEIDRLDPEVRREPRLALDGGRSGLDAIRAIAAQAPRRLKPGGFLVLEIGDRQGRSVLEILAKAGAEEAEIRKDFQGLDRIAAARFWHGASPAACMGCSNNLD